jgi:hypothetical protein
MPTARKSPPQLKLKPKLPKLENATLLLALTGWMDGGDVSSGSVRAIMGRREVRQIGRIEPDDFYIYNFPGSMEIATLFRPHVKYEEGVVTEFELPANIFWADEASNLVFFVGKEPNLRWQAFADCIFSLVKTVGVSRIIFMGSFGGSVPHTREPRMFGSVSHPSLRDLLKEHGLKPSDYEGPGSFATMLLKESAQHRRDRPAAGAHHRPADRPRVDARDEQRLGKPCDRSRGKGREARRDDPQARGGLRQRVDQPGGWMIGAHDS